MRPKIRGALLAANTAGASASAIFAVVGVARPAYVAPGSSADPLARFWATSSAVRTWALTGPLLVGIARGGRSVPPLLAAAGLVQLMDAGLGVRQHSLQMTVLPAAMGLVHLASARVLAMASDG